MQVHTAIKLNYNRSHLPYPIPFGWANQPPPPSYLPFQGRR